MMSKPAFKVRLCLNQYKYSPYNESVYKKRMKIPINQTLSDHREYKV